MTVTFASVGRCIYCGALGSSTKLSSEHIIPYALNGALILPESSCTTCAAVTSKLERKFTRGIFYPLRIITGYRTRRKKEQAKALPVYDPGGPIESPVLAEHIPIDAYPALHTVPTLGPPGILTGANPNEVFSDVKFITWTPIDWEARKARMKAAGFGRRLLGSFQLNDFARLLAKIAHGLAVAEYGYDSFKAFLPEIILGRGAFAPYYIGGSPRNLPAEKGPHRFGTEVHVVGKKVLLVVTIRLFANLPPPTAVYTVVAGEFPSFVFSDW